MRITLFGEDDRIANALRKGGAELVTRGARVVVACGDVGDEAIEAAIAARAHYIDDATAQGVLRERYERHEADARHAGVCAVPGMALCCAPGDLAAHAAAVALGGEPEDPLDEIAIAYAGLHRSLIDAASGPAYVWAHERWDVTTPAAERRRINAAGVERDVVSFPSGEVITIPRHVAVRRVATYESPEGGDWVARTASAFSSFLPALARAGAKVLAPPPDPRPRSFAIHVIARHGFDEAQVTLTGHDAAAKSAAITAWAALALARRDHLPAGVLAPSEVFAPRETLAALGLAVTASFAW